jgi:hypothetical protein
MSAARSTSGSVDDASGGSALLLLLAQSGLSFSTLPIIEQSQLGGIVQKSQIAIRTKSLAALARASEAKVRHPPDCFGVQAGRK